MAAARWSNRRTLTLAYAIMVLAVASNLALHAWSPALLPWSVLPLSLYVAGSALAAPSLTVMALDVMPQSRSLASSCMGCLQTASNALVTAALAPVFWTSARSLALGMALIFAVGAASLLAYLQLSRVQPRTPADGLADATRAA